MELCKRKHDKIRKHLQNIAELNIPSRLTSATLNAIDPDNRLKHNKKQALLRFFALHNKINNNKILNYSATNLGSAVISHKQRINSRKLDRRHIKIRLAFVDFT